MVVTIKKTIKGSSWNVFDIIGSFCKESYKLISSSSLTYRDSLNNKIRTDINIEFVVNSDD